MSNVGVTFCLFARTKNVKLFLRRNALPICIESLKANHIEEAHDVA